MLNIYILLLYLISKISTFSNQIGEIMKKLIVFSLALFVLACGTKKADSKAANQNFATVWELDTEDYDHFVKLLPAQTQALMDVYKKGLVENIYFQQGEETDETYSMGSISMVVRAKDENSARVILDNMPFYRSKIAKYKLFPLGTKWLTRGDAHKQVAAETKQTFVVIWITSKSFDEMQEHAVEQVNETMELYNNGIIENAYLATEVISGTEQGYPVIYFINAKDVNSAKAILDNTVYPRLGYAKYELRPVGTFWLGNINDEDN